LTDEEVRAATNFSITAASAIPWCYYNIFFIYFDTCKLNLFIFVVMLWLKAD